MKPTITNKQAGYDAEAQAKNYLEQTGHTIVATNWYNRWAEIDIITQKEQRIYFVEVKSRRSLMQGSGLEYITPKKLKQMQFACEMWVAENDWD